MIFTSAHIAPNATTPQIFLDHGNKTDGPHKELSEILLFALNTNPSTEWEIMISKIGCHMHATNSGKLQVTSTGFYDIGFTNQATMIRPAPKVGISFGRKSQDIEDRISALGFTKTTQGRNTIFSGIITRENINPVVALRPELDTYVPYGTCSLRGYMAYMMTCRIVELVMLTIPFYATDPESLGSIPQGVGFVVDSENDELSTPFENKFINQKAVNKKKDITNPDIDLKETLAVKGASYVSVPVNTAVRSASFSDPSSITSPGIFFPYFHGLIVDDKITAATIILNRFMSVLGEDPESALKNAENVRGGWKTLAHTHVGMELSHMLYVINLGFACGGKPLAYIKEDGSYLGMVLLGGGLMVTKEGKTHLQSDFEDLQKELKEYNSHDDALINIRKILMEIPDAPKEMSVRTPRAIHNIIRVLTIPNETANALRKQFQRTNFRVDFLEGKRLEHLTLAIRTIQSNDFLPDTAPMSINSPFMFTNSIIESTLSAFGPIAPSFMERTGAAIMIPAVSGESLVKIKQANGRPVLPRGIPVYVKPLQEACTDWKNMKNQHYIKVRTNTQGNYVNSTKAFTGTEGDKLSQRLAEAFGTTTSEREKGGKRKREDGDIGKTLPGNAKGKKIPKSTELIDFFGVSAPSGRNQEEDEMDIEEETFVPTDDAGGISFE